MNEGETVKLKSGGPTMTVNGQSSGGDWLCQWFDREGKLCTGAFPAASLKPYNPDSPAMA